MAASRPDARPGRHRRRPSRPPTLAGALTVLVLGALSLLNPAPAAAQTTAIWSATLTVDTVTAQSGTLFAGCDDDDHQQDNCSLALSDNDLTVHALEFRIEAVYIGNGVLQVNFDKSPLGHFENLNFCVGSTAFNLAAIGSSRFAWATTVSWSDGDMISLSIGSSCDQAPQSSNANLSSLTVRSSTSADGTYSVLLLGRFAATTTTYAAVETVANNVTHVKLTPAAAKDNATVQVGKTGNGNLMTVANGSASQAIALDEGANAIQAVVTAEDGIATKTYTVTVTRAPPPPTVSLTLSPASISENGGASTVTATLSAASSAAVTVTVAAAAVSPALPGDFTLSNNKVLTIAAGQTASAGTVTITAVNNAIDAPDKTVTVSGTASGGGVGNPGDKTLTITDDDGTPTVTLTLSPASISENGGASTVTATLSAASSAAVTVTVAAAAVSPALPGDFTLSNNKVLTIAAGQTASAGTVTITAVNNAIDAPDKTVTVSGTASGGGVGNPGDKTLTITDDDGTPTVTLTLSPASISENGGASTVTATLSAASSAAVTVTVAAAAVSPALPGDFTLSNNKVLTIAAGQTASAGTVTITAVNNAIDAPDKTVTVSGTASGGGVGNPGDKTLTITDDEGGTTPAVRLSAAPNPVAEGSPVTVTARLSAALSGNVMIPVTLTRGTAEAGDHGALASITISSGATSGTGTVTTAQDADTDDETFTVALGALPSTVRAGSPSSVTVTIADDDGGGGGGGGGGGTNRPPAVSASCDPCAVAPGGEVRLTATATDPDGDTLAYAWSAPRGSFAGATDGAAARWTAPAGAGGYTIRVRVSDGRGGSASVSVAVVVTARDPGGLAATQTFAVGVGNRIVRVAVEETLAAMARSHLASARMTLGRRVGPGRPGRGSRLTVMGRSVPLGKSAAREAAEALLAGWAGSRVLSGGGLAEARRTAERRLADWAAGAARGPDGPAAPPDLAASLGLNGLGGLGGDAPMGGTEFVFAWGGGGDGSQEEADGGGGWQLWGQGDIQTFVGGPAAERRYEGDVRTGYVGLDRALGTRWLAGVAVSRSEGAGDWRAGSASGRLATGLTAVHPYLRWSDGATSAWAMAGGGRGTAENTRAGSGAARGASGLELGFGLLEVRRRLADWVGLRADAAWARLGTEAGDESVDGHAVAVDQQRLGFELSPPVRLGPDGQRARGLRRAPGRGRPGEDRRAGPDPGAPLRRGIRGARRRRHAEHRRPVVRGALALGVAALGRPRGGLRRAVGGAAPRTPPAGPRGRRAVDARRARRVRAPPPRRPALRLDRILQPLRARQPPDPRRPARRGRRRAPARPALSPASSVIPGPETPALPHGTVDYPIGTVPPRQGLAPRPRSSMGTSGLAAASRGAVRRPSRKPEVEVEDRLGGEPPIRSDPTAGRTAAPYRALIARATSPGPPAWKVTFPVSVPAVRCRRVLPG